ncbi:MAG: hypothetical protein V8R52_07485 [Coprobacter fastidiosus]
MDFKPHEVTVGKQLTFKIVLHEEAKDLDEVVVIGYGTVRKGADWCNGFDQ